MSKMVGIEHEVLMLKGFEVVEEEKGFEVVEEEKGFEVVEEEKGFEVECPHHSGNYMHDSGCPDCEEAWIRGGQNVEK
jgi:hypothetical protein